MVLTQIRSWYYKYERPIGILSLIGGFIFNAVSLTRVDEFTENFWVIIHLLVVAICIVLLHREKKNGEPINPKFEFWYSTILQFFYGGLLSTFIVFYFRSAVVAVAWPFFVLLGIAFIFSESLKTKYTKLSIHSGYFFLCMYLFFIFFVPVVMHQVGQIQFFISGGFTVAFFVLFILFVQIAAPKKFEENKRNLYLGIAGICIVINALYFFDIIPPLPMTLQDSGIYHSVIRTNTNTYAVGTEEQTMWDKILVSVNRYPTYHTKAGAPAYAFTALFSPVRFNTNIIHEWQRFDSVSRIWITEETIRLGVVGGRDNGYRTYSMITDLVTGKWRVNVKTNTGQTIGRMTFFVEIQSANPVLHTEFK